MVDIKAMAGAIIENMSTKKLVLLGFLLLALQLLTITVGAFIGKLPSNEVTRFKMLMNSIKHLLNDCC